MPDTDQFWKPEKQKNSGDFQPLGHAYKWPLDAPDCWGYKRCMKFCEEKIHLCTFDCPCKYGFPMQFDPGVELGFCKLAPVPDICDPMVVHNNCVNNPLTPFN